MKDQTQAAPNLDAWNAEVAKTSSVTLEQLEALITDYRKKREEAEKFRIEKTKIEKEHSEAQARLLNAMQELGKTKYLVEGVGTLYLIDKAVVTTPKTIEDKKAFFAWLRAEYGEAVMMEKIGVNHQTLQSLYNAAAEEHRAKCEKEGKLEEAAIFTVPGLQPPTNERSVGFRKGKE